MTEGWHRAKIFAIAPSPYGTTVAFEFQKSDGYPQWKTREFWKKDFPEVLKSLGDACNSPGATEKQLVGKQLDVYVVPPSEVTTEELITRIRNIED